MNIYKISQAVVDCINETRGKHAGEAVNNTREILNQTKPQ